MNQEAMIEAIITEFTPMWALNDRGHRVEHFKAVNRCGQLINSRMFIQGEEFPPKLITLFAFFHDLFAWSRNNHQELSARYVATTDHPLFADLTPTERGWVARACREHRASYKGVYTCLFAELAAAADRGMPGDVDGMLERATMYRVDRGAGLEEARVGAVEHLKEKFGTGGYARYPEIYKQAFGPELAAQRLAVDAL